MTSRWHGEPALIPPASGSRAELRLDEHPHLTVIVDAEEEFDWSADFSRSATSTRSISHQLAAQSILDRFGIIPTYAVDYPVASQARAYEPLRELLTDGRCNIAVHLHPWVNPPFVEDVNERNSYPGNLPQPLEKEKLARLKGKIEENFHIEPNIYRAGR